MALPSWPFVHDELSIWRRKSSPLLAADRAAAPCRTRPETLGIPCSTLGCEYRCRVIDVHRRLWEEDLIQYAKEKPEDNFSDVRQHETGQGCTSMVLNCAVG
eukprot:763249-Hanusia_phi.AAC.2